MSPIHINIEYLLKVKNFINTMYIYLLHKFRVSIRVMVFNATFNNISVILWQSVLLVEEAEELRENHQPASSH